MDKKDFGKRIRRFRREKGLDQYQVAEALGVSNTMVSFYETGRNVPSLPRLVTLCRLLDCSSDELLMPALQV